MVRIFTEEDRQKAIETRLRHKKEREAIRNTPEQPIVKPISSAEIESKKAQLEAMRLDIEIEKLRKPDTSIDYYGKMLELQREHNKSLMDMQKANFDTRIELERMKLAAPMEEGGDFDNILESIQPMLPLIIEGMKKSKSLSLYDYAANGKKSKVEVIGKETETPKVDGPLAGGSSLPPLEAQKEVKIEETEKKQGLDYTNAEDVAAYKAKIISGETTEEQAWKDFQEVCPPIVLKSLGYEGFKVHFDKIKAGLE